MPNEIKGQDGQHPVDMCLMGQNSMDQYVTFLVENGINSNEGIVPNRTYTFVTPPQDQDVAAIVLQGTTFSSLDRTAMELFGILGEDGFEIYGEIVDIYGETASIYG